MTSDDFLTHTDPFGVTSDHLEPHKRQKNQLYYKHGMLTVLFVGSQTQCNIKVSFFVCISSTILDIVHGIVSLLTIFQFVLSISGKQTQKSHLINHDSEKTNSNNLIQIKSKWFKLDQIRLIIWFKSYQIISSWISWIKLDQSTSKKIR